MSLATRCTSCGTVFRVVQDQLKVSEGWVRCGRCDEVFNAIEGLFDLEREAPPDWTPPPAPPSQPAAEITAAYQAPPQPAQDDDDVFHLSDEDRIHSRFFQPEQDDVDQTPAQALSPRDRVDFADAQFNDALLADVEAGARGLAVPDSGIVAPTDDRKPSPGFVRAAKRKAFWRRRGVRLGLAGLALLFSTSLALQALFHFRDVAALRWPSTRPLLASMCAAMKCRLELPRRIDDISVESSSLAPSPSGQGYLLSVVLRNRNALTLALPNISLSVTDTRGQLVSRRALTPADFRVDPAALAPSSETTLQVTLSTDGRRISGYTVEIFYP